MQDFSLQNLTPQKSIITKSITAKIFYRKIFFIARLARLACKPCFFAFFAQNLMQDSKILSLLSH